MTDLARWRSLEGVLTMTDFDFEDLTEEELNVVAGGRNKCRPCCPRKELEQTIKITSSSSSSLTSSISVLDSATTATTTTPVTITVTYRPTIDKFT